MRILSVSSAPPRKQIYNYPHNYLQRLNGCCTFIPYTCTFNSQSARFMIDTLTDNLKRKRLPHKVHRAASSSGPTYNDDIKARALWFDWPDRQQVTSQPIAPSYILISCWSSSHDPPPPLCLVTWPQSHAYLIETSFAPLPAIENVNWWTILINSQRRHLKFK